MKQIVILLWPLLFIMNSCSKDDILVGSGRLTSEIRMVDPFNQIYSEGVFDILISQGDVQSVEIIADDNIMHYVKTEVFDDEIKLSLKENNYRDIHVRAIITVLSLNSIKNSGVGNINVENLNIDSGMFILNSGTANIDISGTSDNLSIRNEGSGDINALEFQVNESSLEIIGSGDCKVNTANYLYVNIEGSGDVYYKGSPEIESQILGSGKIIKVN
ncbi:head GIN domain-containing protein [Gaetbulibacter saemankumensis]|uniref:head GIN domain-containing protein n=1 Tax=Gaetbulibacter saemankumensis TaxID=311208 RepID=UPI0004205892|nr:head GIN domain-containing protein [Gaetbulibacter saemankumensis]